MYKSPIDIYIEQVVNDIEEQRDNQICSYITEKFDVQVDREELIKALQYDRHQYEKGYKDGIHEFIEAITDKDFLKYNYGINDIDMQLIYMLGTKILEDYNECKNGQKD